MNEQIFIVEAGSGNELSARQALETDPRLASARDQAGVSVIATTVHAGRLSFAREIAKRRDDLDLFEAACLGDIECVRTVLEALPESIDRHAPDGFSAIGFAAYFGHTELLKFLIEWGADFEAPSANPMQVRPLHSAVAHSDPSHAAAIANPLLEAGADANAQQPGGHTPLHEAVLNDNVELARLLLTYGANPHVSDDEGNSALQLAYAIEHTDLIELFDQTFIS